MQAERPNAATAALAATLADLTLSAAGTVIVQATSSAAIDDVVLAATGSVLVQATLSASIDDLTAIATGTVGSAPAPAGYPWWWPEYVRAELARQRAAREALARTGDLYATAPIPVAAADGEHDRPALGLCAVPPAPFAHAEIFTPHSSEDELLAIASLLLIDSPAPGARLRLVVNHAGPVDDETLAATAAAILLAA